MGQAIAGRDQHCIIAGSALINLKGMTLNKTSSPIALDPDISSTRISQVAGFLAESGQISFNFTNSAGEDFEDVFDAITSNTEVALYLYPSGTGSSKIYMYGNAFLTDLGTDIPLLGTVSCNVGFVSSDSNGFARQTTAA